MSYVYGKCDEVEFGKFLAQVNGILIELTENFLLVLRLLNQNGTLLQEIQP
jgi:hypothetical protein